MINLHDPAQKFDWGVKQITTAVSTMTAVTERSGESSTSRWSAKSVSKAKYRNMRSLKSILFSFSQPKGLAQRLLVILWFRWRTSSTLF